MGASLYSDTRVAFPSGGAFVRYDPHSSQERGPVVARKSPPRTEQGASSSRSSSSSSSSSGSGPRRGGPGGKRGERMRPRKYTRINSETVDYKDLLLLRRFISDRGKVRSRRVTGLSRQHQRELALAVKRARELAMRPYVGER